MNLDSSIEFVKNIGPERAKFIQGALGLFTANDFLQYYPLRFVDKSKIHIISDLANATMEVQLYGQIYDLQEVNNGKFKRLSAKFKDASGSMDLVWFQYSKWQLQQIPTQQNVYIFGKINLFNHRFSMAHPEIEIEKKSQLQHLTPIYPSSEKLVKRGLNQKFFQQSIATILRELKSGLEENLPLDLIAKEQLISHQEAVYYSHFPRNLDDNLRAETRIKWEESFFFQMGYALKKKNHQTHSVGNPMKKVGDFFNNFYKHQLPFALTNAQIKVLKEIRKDMTQPTQMNRLLQGDVGSGKTIVALLSMLLALDNGFQSCLLAPTEILAQQHFNALSALLANTTIHVRLLTGSTKASERKTLFQDLENGKISLLIGTHALLEDKVIFANLGLAIIDEQHRFGVEQRAKLWRKNKIPPHILVMTATPIPRTLAMSFYSDLEVSIIDELPAGRKEIITAHRKDKDRASVYQFVKDEIAKGRQIYMVYPLIEESESLAAQNLMQSYEEIRSNFPQEFYTIGVLHGKMKPTEKEDVMKDFVEGKTQIMMATTVIEVGVNVPNASLMIIESAQRFGLSQLHQLRGRVGRGSEQSYCVLMTHDALTSEGRKRISTMCQTNDGFKISEVDLELRGPGDILGTQQSGTMDFKKLSLQTDGELIQRSKKWVDGIIHQDPNLMLSQHQATREYYTQFYKGKNKWYKIS